MLCTQVHVIDAVTWKPPLGIRCLFPSFSPKVAREGKLFIWLPPELLLWNTLSLTDNSFLSYPSKVTWKSLHVYKFQPDFFLLSMHGTQCFYFLMKWIFILDMYPMHLRLEERIREIILIWFFCHSRPKEQALGLGNIFHGTWCLSLIIKMSSLVNKQFPFPGRQMRKIVTISLNNFGPRNLLWKEGWCDRCSFTWVNEHCMMGKRQPRTLGEAGE